MNLQKILLLSDFNEASNSLLNYGLALAREFSAQLWIQHVYYIPPNVAGEVFIPTEVMENYEKGLYEEFDQLKQQMPELRELNADFVVNYGDLIQEMNRLIDRQQIDLVVVSNQGGGLLTNILGSNVMRVIQHAHCPVLSVPEGSIFRPFRRIALALDLKETHPELIEMTTKFGQAFKARLDLVHVSEAPIPIDIKQVIHSLDKELSGIPYHFFFVHEHDVEKGIEHHLEGNNNDLLVLLPRVHSFFYRIFQKSITQQVAYQKKVPLLTLHP